MIIQVFQNFIHTKAYPYYTKLWVEKHRKIKQGDVVIDAGAYLGGFTLLLSNKVGNEGKVISFEPDYNNFKGLEENVEKSGVTNVVLLNKALGSKKGKIRIESSSHFSSSVIKQGNKPVNEVEQNSLDSELSRLDIKRVDVLKMNIEGAEIEAIKGAVKTLNKTSYVAISSHIVNEKHSAYKIQPILNELGFKTIIETRAFKFTGHIDLYGIRE